MHADWVERFTTVVNRWGERKKIMRTLLEHDSVALAVLVIGITAVELLALSF
jgi:hypothetical protein